MYSSQRTTVVCAEKVKNDEHSEKKVFPLFTIFFPRIAMNNNAGVASEQVWRADQQQSSSESAVETKEAQFHSAPFQSGSWWRVALKATMGAKKSKA